MCPTGWQLDISLAVESQLNHETVKTDEKISDKSDIRSECRDWLKASEKATFVSVVTLQSNQHVKAPLIDRFKPTQRAPPWLYTLEPCNIL